MVPEEILEFDVQPVSRRFPFQKRHMLDLTNPFEISKAISCKNENKARRRD